MKSLTMNGSRGRKAKTQSVLRVGFCMLGLLMMTASAWAASPSSLPGRAVAPPQVVIEAVYPTAAEGGGEQGVIRIARTGPTNAPLAVHFDISGTATRNVDYQMRVLGGVDVIDPTVMTIPAGAESAIMSLWPINDTQYEGAETAIFAIRPDAAYAAGGASSATIAIYDNDAPYSGLVTLETLDGEATEGSTTDTATVRFVREGVSDSDLAVSFRLSNSALADWSALARDETSFAPIASPLLIFAGETSRTIRLLAPNDNLVQAPRKVQVDLLRYAGNPAQANIVIYDDEPPVVTVSPWELQASESYTHQAQFNLKIEPHTINPNSLDFQYELTGSATRDVDYNVFTSVAKDVVYIRPIDDDLVEGPETVVLTLKPSRSYRIGSPSSLQAVINDNESSAAPPSVGISPNEFTLTEGGGFGAIQLSRSTVDASADLDLDFKISGDAVPGIDYAILAAGRGETAYFPVLGPLTIFAGEQSRSVRIFPIDDNVVETDFEHASLELVQKPGYYLIRPTDVQIDIRDNEVKPVVRVLGGLGPASESHRISKTFRFFADTSNGYNGSAVPVTFALEGSAVNGADYTSVPLSISISADVLNQILIVPIDDNLPEGTEHARLRLVVNGRFRIDPASPEATVDILDNDPAVPPEISITALEPVALESRHSARVRISRPEPDPDADLDVPFAISGDARLSLDYSGAHDGLYDYYIMAAARGETSYWPINSDGASPLNLPLTIYEGESHRDLLFVALAHDSFDPDKHAVISVLPSASFSIDPPAAADVTIRDRDAPPDTPETRLVLALYDRLLNRYPESRASFDYWITRLTQIRVRQFDIRMSVLDILREFALTPEAQGRIPGPALSPAFVDGAYGVFLRRPATADEQTSATTRPGAGREETMHYIKDSPEFDAFIETQFPAERGETYANFANRGYDFLVERVADLGGLASWKSWLKLNPDKREVSVFLARLLIDTPEFRDKSPDNHAQADKILRFFLDRFPTPAEIDDWAGKLDNHLTTIPQMCDELSQSPEFIAVLDRYFPGWQIKRDEALAAVNAAERDWELYR